MLLCYLTQYLSKVFTRVRINLCSLLKISSSQGKNLKTQKQFFGLYHNPYRDIVTRVIRVLSVALEAKTKDCKLDLNFPDPPSRCYR